MCTGAGALKKKKRKDIELIIGFYKEFCRE